MCPFIGVSKRTESAFGMGIAVLFVMTLASAISSIIDDYILVPFNIEYLQTIAFILIISSLVQFLELFMKKYFRGLYNVLGVYLPLITTNCAILGVVLLNVQENYNFIQSIVNSAGAGIGFTLAIVLLSTVREKYEFNTDLPVAFKGLPLAFISTGLLSLAFMGFYGM
jgi:electron transport complex protein RnfA